MTRTAVVTGGTAGVGRATVRELAAAGYDVAVLARGQAGLDGAVADVEAAGQRALSVVCDVADPDAVERAARQVEEGLGEIDLWVNLAFVGSLAFFWDTTVEEFRRVTEVTYYGQVYGTRAALARMRPRDRGVVVNVGSAMAYRSIPLQSAYCGAKHAVKGFTESVMTELAHERSRVRVCMVQLPALNTPQFTWNLERVEGHPRPVAPVWQPEVAARSIRFLAEHPRRNMWVGVATVYTVLGERLAPKLVDLYLGRYGVAGQQTSEDLPRRGTNLDEPRDAEVDAGAHGPFDAEAWRRDPQTWVSVHRRALLGTAAATALSGALLGVRGRGRSRGEVRR
jgi:NAD(P)-dependent dehydrogenase (short-subunit alcohol dehydrogenase family)